MLGPSRQLSRRKGRPLHGRLPVILPVNDFVFDHGVLFRTAAGTKLDAAVRGIVVAFEADAYDPGGRAGWSVLLVRKAARSVTLSRSSAPKLQSCLHGLVQRENCTTCISVLSGSRAVSSAGSQRR